MRHRLYKNPYIYQPKKSISTYFEQNWLLFINNEFMSNHVRHKASSFEHGMPDKWIFVSCFFFSGKTGTTTAINGFGERGWQQQSRCEATCPNDKSPLKRTTIWALQMHYWKAQRTLNEYINTFIPTANTQFDHGKWNLNVATQSTSNYFCNV